jgi:CubicO group peptidase (beta-lactamase class C family)
MRPVTRLATAALLAAAVALPSFAAELPRAGRAEEVGLNGARLTRLSEWLEGEVRRGAIPGAVILVGRQGRIAQEIVAGFRDREASQPMRADAIFRIASMTKPIVSLAVMMLAEEGRISIAAPIGDYLPEWRETPKVGVPRDGGMVLEDARRPITVQDLLRHTSGLADNSPGDHPVSAAYRASTARDRSISMEEMSRRVAALPLMHQPGTTWEYSWSTDILGRLVEVVGGTDLDSFIRGRITGPLGMTDTGFFAPAAAADRIAQPQVDPGTGRRPAMFDPLQRPGWFSGAGGMVSTARDYARFAQFLLNKGELDGQRLVSRKTIELMMTDQLPPGVATRDVVPARFGPLATRPETSHGFGLGFAVRTAVGPNPLPGSVGNAFWGGAQGTFFWVDPQEQMFVVLMMQSPSARLPFRAQLHQLTYQALN